MARGRRLVHVGEVDRGQAGHGQALRHLAEEGHPAARQPEHGTAAMPATTTRSDTGRFGSSHFPSSEHAERGDAEGERRGIRLAEVREEVAHPLPEIAVAALEPEELRQLRAGQVQGDPGLEAGHDRLGDEAHEAPRAHEPGDERQGGDDQGGGRRECRVACRVAPGEVPERGAHEERDRRGDGDGGVARAAEEPEHEPREEAGVEAGLGREARERGVTDAGRQQVGREHEARHDVCAQEVSPVVAQQAQAGHAVRAHAHPPSRMAMAIWSTPIATMVSPTSRGRQPA